MKNNIDYANRMVLFIRNTIRDYGTDALKMEMIGCILNEDFMNCLRRCYRRHSDMCVDFSTDDYGWGSVEIKKLYDEKKLTAHLRHAQR